MKSFIELLKSLFVPLFNGIRLVLTGKFGLPVAVVAWAQLFIQVHLGLRHTSNLGGAIVLAVVLFIGQAAAALWAFLTANGAAFETNPKKIASWTTIKRQAVTVSSIFILAYTMFFGIVFNVLHIVRVHGFVDLFANGAVIAAITAYFLVRRLERLAEQQTSNNNPADNK